MATRRTALTLVAVLGCVLVPVGVLLVADGVHAGGGGHAGRTVAGILLTLAGLICLRILSWARRIRLMTQAGLAQHVPEEHHDDE